MRDTASLRAEIAGLRRDYESRLRELVEIPSVSVEPARAVEVARCAERAAGYLRQIGAEARVVATGGHPLVLGRLQRDPTFPTVTIYNHLDVQPADPADWHTPPFTLSPAGDKWHARGTTDDKGPALAAFYGAKLAARDGARVNIQFLWELEEEIGSPNFAATLARLVREGLATDSVVVSDTIWIAAGRPAIPYGLRGLLGFTIHLRTGKKDVHSGTTGGAARNPIGELADLCAKIYDARTGRVKIPGFYAKVRKVTAAERRGFLRAGFSRASFQAAHELSSVRFSDDARLAEAIMAQPTFEVHGIVGGYAGPGVKTIVPHTAEAKLSMRLVPDQDPAAIFRLVQAFVRRHNPDAEVRHESTLPPFLGEQGGPLHDAARAAMRETFGAEPGTTREGGSIGAVLSMRELLGAPIVFLGLSLPEHGYHAVDENFDWGQARGGIELFYRWFFKLAELPRPYARASTPTTRKRAAPRAGRRRA